MKRFSALFAAIVLMFVLTGCGMTTIEPGKVGIKVNYYGSEKGVEDYPLLTGVQFYNPFTSTIIEYPVSVQQATWTQSATEGSPNDDSITFNADGMAITTDIGLAYYLQRDKVPQFYMKFRSDDLHSITHQYLRNIIRDAFNKAAAGMKVEEMYTSKRDKMLDDVKKMVNDSVNKDGIVVEQLTLIGKLNVPQTVESAINAKITATQNAIAAENELRQTEANAKKLIAKAEGEATANKLLANSITPTLIELKKIDLEFKKIDKWNGVMPQIQAGGSGGSGMILQIPSPR